MLWNVRLFFTKHIINKVTKVIQTSYLNDPEIELSIDMNTLVAMERGKYTPQSYSRERINSSSWQYIHYLFYHTTYWTRELKIKTHRKTHVSFFFVFAFAYDVAIDNTMPNVAQQLWCEHLISDVLIVTYLLDFIFTSLLAVDRIRKQIFNRYSQNCKCNQLYTKQGRVGMDMHTSLYVHYVPQTMYIFFVALCMSKVS